MATHYSILAWEIPWTEGAWQATVHCCLVIKSNWTLCDPWTIAHMESTELYGFAKSQTHGVPSVPILFRVFVVNRCWILPNVFFSIYWDNHMIIILCFVTEMCHVDWFIDIKKIPASLVWMQLIIVHDPFNTLLNLFCYILLEDFYVYVHQDYWLVIYFFVVSVWSWYWGNATLIKWVWKWFFLSVFWNSLRMIGIYSYKYFVEFTCKVICNWIFIFGEYPHKAKIEKLSDLAI